MIRQFTLLPLAAYPLVRKSRVLSAADRSGRQESLPRTAPDGFLHFYDRVIMPYAFKALCVGVSLSNLLNKVWALDIESVINIFVKGRWKKSTAPFLLQSM